MRVLVADVVLAAGVGLLLLSTAGTVLMRDAFDRLHYAAAAAWGTMLVALAILVRESFSLIADKALLAGAVLLVAGPSLAHATARALRVRRRGTWKQR